MVTLNEWLLGTLEGLNDGQQAFWSAQGVPPKMVAFLAAHLTPLLPWIGVTLSIAVLLIIVLGNLFIVIWVERKLIARMHDRRGPSHVGYAGLLQNLADGLKLLGKEMITPTKADKFGYNLAPLLLMAASLVAISVIPISSTLFVANVSTSALFVLAVLSITPLAIFLAGWSSNNKYTLIGALRATAQLIAYEIPLILSVVGIAILAGSLNLIEIVNMQSRVWFILIQPIGFMLFIIAVLAEVERIPFDLPEAEAELVEGWWTEYGGIKFGLFQFSEYFRAFAGAALITLLFLGGWQGPILPPELWFFIKFYVVFAVMVWVRAALPRVRIDQLLSIGWRKLLPLAMVNILIATIVVSLGVPL
ncbi:MAG: NADH-quinone oxidoreductase subunit NuoH [Candidatus Bathyarchaeia archaeon]